MANTDIYSLGSTSAIVKANKKIKRGEEITVFYGPHYFGENNKDCMCHSCEYKEIGHFQVNQVNEQGAGRLMTNSDFSGEYCSEEERPRDDVFTCNMCGKIFLFKCWLSRHIASHMIPVHACEKCDRVFNRKDTLKRHIKTVHVKNAAGPSHSFVSPVCIDFATEYSLIPSEKKSSVTGAIEPYSSVIRLFM